MATAWLLIASMALTIPVAPQATPQVAESPNKLSLAFKISLAYNFGINIADYLSTRSVLRNGGVEANPFMAPFVESDAAFLAVKVVGTTAINFALAKVYKENKTLAWIGTRAAPLYRVR